ncbi:MAG: FG-GAP-like repeat-containing protein [Phycisphaerae bacterium]|nr:FG-GAP-like repeat-containing protein [Phycisphaerae bacterium]
MSRTNGRFRTRKLRSQNRQQTERAGASPLLENLECRVLLSFTPIALPITAYINATTNMAASIPADATPLNTLTDGTETLALSDTVTAGTVPGTWTTWNSPAAVESATPRVLNDTGSTSLTITLSVPADVFGFEAEPSNFAVFNLTATFMDGASVVGSISLNVDGNSGALLFAAATDQVFTSVVLTANIGANGFAIAQPRYHLPAPTYLVGDALDNQLLIQQDGTGFTDFYVDGVLQTHQWTPTVRDVYVTGLLGDDTLTVDSSNGLVVVSPGGIHYDGGTGLNALALTQIGGDTQATGVYTVGPNPGEGLSVITGASGVQVVEFQNLAPVVDLVPAVTATVNATDAANAIDYRVGSVATNGLISIDNQESYEFSNKTNLVINGQAGSDEINLNNPNTPTGLTGTITVNGNDPTASDTLIVNGIAGTLDNLRHNPTGLGAGNVINDSAPQPQVNFTGVEHLTLVVQEADGDGVRLEGTVGNDQFEFTPGATRDSGTFTGTMDANNATAVGPFVLTETSYRGVNSAADDVDVNFNNPGGTDALVFNGTAVSDGLSVSLGEAGGTQFQNIVDGLTVARLEGFNLTSAVVRGLDGNDTMSRTTVNAVTVTFDGGDPSGSDSLTLTGTVADETIGLNLATGVVTGLGGAVTLVGVEDLAINGGGAATFDTFNVTSVGVVSETADDLETVTLNGANAANLNATGTTGDNIINVTPTGNGTGSFQAAGVAGPLVVYTGFATGVAGAGVFTVAGGGGFDVLGLLGSPGADVVTATAPNVVTSNGGNVTVGAGIGLVNVSTLAGDDTVDLTNLTTGVPTAIDGGDGNDTLTGTPGVDYLRGGFGNDSLFGLAGADTLDGGPGNDLLNGGLGDDMILYGDNSDTGTWNGGDGNDTVEGGDGTDVLVVNGTVAADTFVVSEVGRRVVVTGTSNGPFTLSLGQVEQLDINALAGADSVTINDLARTDMELVNIDTGTDADLDAITLNGGTGPDNVALSMNADDAGASNTVIDVKGLAARVQITSTTLTAAADTLTVNTLDGNDSIVSAVGTSLADAANVSNHVNLTFNGGNGNDYLEGDATLNGGDGNDTLVSGPHSQLINGGNGIDRVVSKAIWDTTLPFTFTLNNTSLVRDSAGNGITGGTVDTDTLTGIEEGQLIGGTGNDQFNIGAFYGRVLLKGDLGSDTVDYSAYAPVALLPHNTNPGVIVDLDLTNTEQTVNERGSILFLSDPIENMNGSEFKDSIFVDALAVARLIDGNDPVFGDGFNVPPGDLLTVDARGQFTNVNRIVGGQPQADAGTVTAFGYQPVTFQEIEKLAVVNTLGSTGLTGFNAQAYTASVNYLTGSKRPRSMATGDFNEDGWNDMVAVNSTAPGVASVLIGRGYGTFDPAAIFSMGTYVRRLYDVAVTDLDGDGHLDIISSGLNRRNQDVVLFMRGNGDGTFQTPVTTVTTLKGAMTGLALGDIDGDADVDVIITGAKQVMALVNDGAGNLTTSQTILSNGKTLRGVVVEDLNHDGAVDIAVANYHNSTVSVFLNDGTGVFSLTGDFSTVVGKNGRVPTSMVLGDFNNDGNWDLAVSDVRRNALSVLLGDGLGSFQLQSQAKYVEPFITIAAGDFNSDGKTDIVLGSAKNFVSVLVSTGNGTFSDPYVFNVGNVRQRQPAGLIVADFNNDGGLDLAIADAGSNAVSVLLKNLVI